MKLKHKQVLDSLTVRQKLSILASGHLPEASKDVPGVYAADLEASAPPQYPALHSAANSFCDAMWTDFAAALACSAREQGANAAITPDMSVNTHVYRIGISEDPYLIGRIASAYAGGILRYGLTPIFSGCSVREQDAPFLDALPAYEVLTDSIVRPFETAYRMCGGAVATELSDAPANQGVMKAIQDKRYAGARTVCQTQDAGVEGLIGNAFLLNGNVEKLEAAYNASRQQQPSVGAAQSTAAANGALHENQIDMLADEVLSFAAACQDRLAATTKPALPPDADGLAAALIEASVVLLKNDKTAQGHPTLPLFSGMRVAAIGSAATQLDEALKAYNQPAFTLSGTAEGYREDGERDDALVQAACELAQNSDAVLLFLGFTPQMRAQIPNTRRLVLDAAQLALADALHKTGKPVIGLLTDGYAADTRFDTMLSALLVYPDTGNVLVPLIRILSGAVNPSGKLANTFYSNPDSYFAGISERRASGNLQIGSFFGYRGYDTTNLRGKYPFGHGLSYTTFRYSDFKLTADGATFRIKNTGMTAGFEVAQLYVGKEKSALPRPRRELKGYIRVFLTPGESRTVQIPLDSNLFLCSDPVDKQRKVEAGVYDIFVGASLSDIRLQGTLKLTGGTIEGTNARLSEFLMTDNIAEGGYTTVQSVKPPRQILKIPAMIAIALTVIYDIFVFANATAAFSQTVWALITTFFILLNLLLILCVVYLIISGVRRQKYIKREAQRVAALQANAPLLSGENSLLQTLFLDEFQPKKAAEGQPETEDEPPLSDEDLSSYIDASLTVTAMTDSMRGYIAACGVSVPPASLRAVLCAFACSHNITLLAADVELLTMFICGLCDCFGTPVFVEGSIASAEKAVNENAHLIHVLADAPDKNETAPNLFYIDTELTPQSDTVVELSLKKSNPAKERTAPVLNLYQLESWANAAPETHFLSESNWKKLDKLVALSGGGIGNRAWRRIERYTALYLMAGGGEAEAVDSAAAVRLLPALLPAITERSDKDNSLTLRIEGILGEQDCAASVAICRRWSKVQGGEKS